MGSRVAWLPTIDGATSAAPSGTRTSKPASAPGGSAAPMRSSTSWVGTCRRCVPTIGSCSSSRSWRACRARRSPKRAVARCRRFYTRIRKLRREFAADVDQLDRARAARPRATARSWAALVPMLAPAKPVAAAAGVGGVLGSGWFLGSLAIAAGMVVVVGVTRPQRSSHARRDAAVARAQPRGGEPVARAAVTPPAQPPASSVGTRAHARTEHPRDFGNAPARPRFFRRAPPTRGVLQPRPRKSLRRRTHWARTRHCWAARPRPSPRGRPRPRWT